MFHIAPPEADALAALEELFLTNNSKSVQHVQQAIADS